MFSIKRRYRYVKLNILNKFRLSNLFLGHGTHSQQQVESFSKLSTSDKVYVDRRCFPIFSKASPNQKFTWDFSDFRFNHAVRVSLKYHTFIIDNEVPRDSSGLCSVYYSKCVLNVNSARRYQHDTVFLISIKSYTFEYKKARILYNQGELHHTQQLLLLKYYIYKLDFSFNFSLFYQVTNGDNIYHFK